MHGESVQVDTWLELQFFLSFLALPLAATALLGLPFARTRRVAFQSLVAAVTFVAATYGFIQWSREVRFGAFARLAERSGPLVAAIRAFEEARGQPPANLHELVPEFIDAVPGTGMPNYPAYEYAVFEPKDFAMLHWYYLGSRGKEFLWRWFYPDGDLGHAILVLLIDGQGIVRRADTDRLPRTLGREEFTTERWKTRGERMAMVSDLLESLPLKGRPFEEVMAILGEPDGTRDLRNAWELRVDCMWGGWDRFVYWPSESYPGYFYGGSATRIDAWAYVVE